MPSRPQPSGDRPAIDPDRAVAWILLRWLEIAQSRPLRPRVWRRASDRWIAILLGEISRLLGDASVRLLAQVGPQWEELAKSGPLPSPGPAVDAAREALILDSLDSPQPVVQDRTVAVAVHRGGETIEAKVLLARRT